MNMATATADAGTVSPGFIEDIDAALAAEVAPFRETAVVQAITFASKIGDQPPMRVLCGATIAIGLISANSRVTQAGLRMLVAHTLATGSKNFLKRRIDRTRPDARGDGDDHRVRSGKSDAHDETSFPSGHSAGAIAVGAAFAREFPKYRLGSLCAAGAVALAQVPRGAHYLSDVVVGSAIGAISEAALDRTLALICRSKSHFSSDRRQAASLRELKLVEKAARHVR
jgi:membrane-associated phospholipid phosphatase